MTTTLDAPSANSRSLANLLRWTSGTLALFLATGGGFFISGLCAWLAEGVGARGQLLINIADASLVVGFVATLFGLIAWYVGRCRHRLVDLPPTFLLIALLALPAGAICWAIFVDAIAWHLRHDIVRPAVDIALMYLVLGSVVPVTVGIPFALSRLRRLTPS